MKTYKCDYRGEKIIVNDISNQMTTQQIYENYILQKNRIDKSCKPFSSEKSNAYFVFDPNGKFSQLAALFGAFLECLPSQ